MLADSSRLADPSAAHRTFADPARFWTVVVVFWTVYASSGCYRLTPYNAHVFLAYSLLHRHFDLISPPGHFELLKLAGHDYVAYGIGPSLLMLPFVALW